MTGIKSEKKSKNENVSILQEDCQAFGLTEAATECVLQEKVFLEISQHSQENTCARVSFLIKLHALGFFTEHLRTTASWYRWQIPKP